MANKYPYVASAGPLVKTVDHLRRTFPKELTVETLRKLGVAPKNESYVINVLRFIGIIDDEGKKVDAKAKAFLQHQDDAFASEFKKLVQEAYEELFELYGEATWTKDRSDLTQFFRTTDHTSDVVGTRQAGTFAALSALAGNAEVPKGKTGTSVPKTRTTPAPRKDKKNQAAGEVQGKAENGKKLDGDGAGIAPVGLTVRIEVNLPASGDQETYDLIFKSIRKNLLNGSSN